MSLGLAFRQIVESMPEDRQKEYKDKIMTNVVKQFSEITKKQENDILNGIEDLINRLHTRADIREQITSRKSVQEGKPDKINGLLREAATTIDILAERIIDSENTSGLRVYELEQKLLTKQAYIDYLKSRLDDFDIGYQPE